jgi:hypothetical protein
MQERPSSTDVEHHLNGKLHLIQAHEGKVTKILWFAVTESEQRQDRNIILL